MRNNLVGFSEETLQKYNLIRTQPVWFNEGEEVLPGICIWQTFTSRITKLLSCSHEVGAKTACGIGNFFFTNSWAATFWVVGTDDGNQHHKLLLLFVPLMYSIFLFLSQYHVLHTLPKLSVELESSKKNESFTRMGRRMSDLIWRWLRLCAWSGRLWHHYRTSFIHWKLFFICYFIVCVVAVPINALLQTCSNGQNLTQRNYVGGIRKHKKRDRINYRRASEIEKYLSI